MYSMLMFIGQDGSLGLKHGELYEVELLPLNHMFYVTVKRGLVVKAICPYETLVGFAKNWTLPK